MEERIHSIPPVDVPETISPSANSPVPDSPPLDLHDELGNASQNSIKPEKEVLGLSQRLSEAFRDGVASTKPDYAKRPEVKIPPPEKKNRPESSDAGILDGIIQEGGSAVAMVGDKVAGAVDSVVQLLKNTPVMTGKYAQAFREGAASVKSGEGRQRRQEPEQTSSTKINWLPSGGGVILDKVIQSVDSATEIVRSVLKPGEGGGAGNKIGLNKKKIDNLYIEIGRETVSSWNSGAIETEKISELLAELRKNEEEIQNLQDHIAEAAAARKPETPKRRQAAKETELNPADSPSTEPVVEAEAVPHKEAPPEEIIANEEKLEVETPANPAATEPVVEAEAVLHEEASPEEIIASEEKLESESPANLSATEPVVEVETVPHEEAPPEEVVASGEKLESESPSGFPAPEETVSAEVVPQDEAIEVSDQDQAMSEEPEAGSEKPDGRPKGPRGRIQGRR